MAENTKKYYDIPTSFTDADKEKYPNNDPAGRLRPVGTYDSQSGGRVLGVTWQLWDENIGQRQQDINQELYDLAYAGL